MESLYSTISSFKYVDIFKIVTKNIDSKVSNAIIFVKNQISALLKHNKNDNDDWRSLSLNNDSLNSLSDLNVNIIEKILLLFY